MEYHKFVVESHTNLVVKFSFLKDLDDVDLFNTSRVGGRKEGYQGKWGVEVTEVIT